MNAIVGATEEISQVLNNLVMMATTDCDMVEQLNGVIRKLTESKKQLTDSNKTLMTQIKLLTEMNVQLIK